MAGVIEILGNQGNGKVGEVGSIDGWCMICMIGWLGALHLCRAFLAGGIACMDGQFGALV